MSAAEAAVMKQLGWGATGLIASAGNGLGTQQADEHAQRGEGCQVRALVTMEHSGCIAACDRQHLQAQRGRLPCEQQCSHGRDP